MKRAKQLMCIVFAAVLIFGSTVGSAVAANDQTTQSYLYSTKYTQAVNHYTDYKFYKAESLQFAIPGISDGSTGGVKVSAGFYRDYIPQGICYSTHTAKFYITAYSESKQNSVIFVLSSAGKYERTLEIENYTAHAGGVACDDNYLYYVSGLSVYYTGLDTVTAALKAGSNTVTVTKKRIAVTSDLCGMNVGSYTDSNNLFSSCSFCTYFNGLLWFGEFSLDTENDDYPYRSAGESYFFGVDMSTPSAPQLKKVMTVPCKCQGASFFKDSGGNTYLVCSMSYGRNNASTMRFYKLNQSEWGTDGGYGGGTQASSGITHFVHKNTNIKSFEMPNLMEGICAYATGGKVYVMSVYESGAQKYASSASYVMDRVSAVNINSALSVTTAPSTTEPAHRFVQTAAVAPDCTTAGHSDYACSICGKTSTVNIPATGHDYSAKIESEQTLCADYTGEPEYYYTCNNCGLPEHNDSHRFAPQSPTIYGSLNAALQPKALTATLLLNGVAVAQKTLEGDGMQRFVFFGLAPGDYSLRLSGKNLLPLTIEGLQAEAGAAEAVANTLVDSNPLPNGDINADACIDIGDVSALLQSDTFGKTGEGMAADMNDDGSADILDLQVILSADNYGKTQKTILSH